MFGGRRGQNIEDVELDIGMIGGVVFRPTLVLKGEKECLRGTKIELLVECKEHIFNGCGLRLKCLTVVEYERRFRGVKCKAKVKGTNTGIEHVEERTLMASEYFRKVHGHIVQIRHIQESVLSCNRVVPCCTIVRFGNVHVD